MAPSRFRVNKSSVFLVGAISVFLLVYFRSPRLSEVENDRLVGHIVDININSGSLMRKHNWYWGMRDYDRFFASNYPRGEAIKGKYKIIGKYKYTDWLPFAVINPAYEMYYLLAAKEQKMRVFVHETSLDIDCKLSRAQLGMLCVQEDAQAGQLLR